MAATKRVEVYINEVIINGISFTSKRVVELTGRWKTRITNNKDVELFFEVKTPMFCSNIWIQESKLDFDIIEESINECTTRGKPEHMEDLTEYEE